MKKYIIIASLAVGALTYGQVQVQTTPQNTINNQNPFLDASGYNKFGNNVGKGLYFPTTDLTKWEFKTDLVNPGNFSNYFDGMIVYNTGEGDPTTEASVGGIRKNLTRGFYYFKNPGATFPTGSVASGEWVRLNDSFASDQEWKFNPTNQHIELVRSGKGTFKNKVFYNKNGFFQNYTNNEWTFWDWQSNSYITRNIPEDYRFNYSQRSSKEIEDVLGVDYKILSATRLLVNEDSGTKYGMEADQTVLQIEKENTANYGYMASLSSVNSHFGRGNVDNLLGGVFTTELRESATAIQAVGVHGRVSLNNTSHAKNIRGGVFFAGINGNSYASDIVGAVSSANDNGRDVNGNIKAFTGFRAYLQFFSKGASAIPSASGLEIKPLAYTNNATQITDLRGLYYNPDWRKANTTSVENEYGIYLEDVSKGKTLNYAIYTNVGKVRFGDTVDIYAARWSDVEKATGKKTAMIIDLVSPGFDGEMTKSIVSQWADKNPNYIGHRIDFGLNAPNVQTDPFMAFSVAPQQDYPSNEDMSIERMRITSRGNVGIGTTSPTEKLEVAGAVKAQSFKGANGATIFPDYVFENYYKGNLATKVNYTFKNLNEVESFVKTNGHLPGYQSAKEVKEQGYIDIIDTQLTNVEKIEELYLHLIEKEKEVQALKTELATQKARLDKLEKLLIQ